MHVFLAFNWPLDLGEVRSLALKKSFLLNRSLDLSEGTYSLKCSICPICSNEDFNFEFHVIS